MHEFSIARALARIAAEHIPRESGVQRVRLRVGPLQSIVPGTLNLAWTAATAGGALRGAELDVEYLPWRLACPDCGRCWESERHDEPCVCGCTAPTPRGSGELTLMSIDVEGAPDALPTTAAAAGRD